MELTVLGCSGSYGAPGGGACSGYLVRDGRHDDLGRLRQRHVRPPAGAHRRRPTSRRSSSPTSTPTTASTSTACTSCYRYGLERTGPAGVRARGAREAGSAASSPTGATRSTGTSSTTATRPPIGDVGAAVLAHRPPAADRTRSRSTARRAPPDLHRRHRPGLERRRVRCRRRPRALGGHVPCTTTSRSSIHLSARAGRRRGTRGEGPAADAHPHLAPGSTRWPRSRRAPRRSATPSPWPPRTWSSTV